MTQQKNSVTTKKLDEAKKAPVKKVAVKKEEIEKAVVKDQKVLVFFESGAGYSTVSGINFSQTFKMEEVPLEEANFLLTLDNFRLPNDEEKELYYNKQEG
jgi:hypothetical protein